MFCHLLVSKTGNPFFNLSAEEFLLTEYPREKQSIYLFFYENKESVVLGKTLDPQKELYRLKKKKVPVIRRGSGGGSVVHFKGNLNYAIIIDTGFYKEYFPIKDSYQKILKLICRSIFPSLDLSVQGISDITAKQRGVYRKISGNSQIRKRGALLHHGTIIYDTQKNSAIRTYLRPPPKKPEYRKERNHKSFMAPYLPVDTPAGLIRKISRDVAEEFSLNLINSSALLEEFKKNSTFLNRFIGERKLQFPR